MHQSTVRMLFLHSDGSSLLGSELSISWKRFQGNIQTKPKTSASDWMHSFESASVFCSQARWRVLRGCSAAPGLTPVFQNAGCVTGRETVLMGVTNFPLLAVVNSSELIISKNEASSRHVFARCHFVATYFVPQQIKEPTNQTPTANLCVTCEAVVNRLGLFSFSLFYLHSDVWLAPDVMSSAQSAACLVLECLSTDLQFN